MQGSYSRGSKGGKSTTGFLHATYRNIINVVHSLSSDKLRGLLPAGTDVLDQTKRESGIGTTTV